MSVRNGKLTRRAGLAMGSACFLATMALSSSHADASATLALVPTGTLPTGAVVSGSATTGYTLTLPTGSTSTFSYDVVVTVTGSTPSVARIQGAVVPSYTNTNGDLSGGTNPYTVGYSETYSGVTYTNAANGTSGAFQLTSASTAGQAFGTSYSFKPGIPQTIATSSSAVLGVGPQSGTFSSLVNTGGANSSNGRVQVTYATPVGTTGSIDALTSSATLAGTTGDTVSLGWADGTGNVSSTPGAGTVYQSALEWSENGSSFFSGVSGSYTQFGLNVVFAQSGPFIGDIPGDLNGDGTVNFSDLGILLSNYGSTGLSVPSDYALGDINGDGSVDFSDLGILLSNYGSVYTPPGVGPSFRGGAVPEPANMSFVAIGAMALAGRRSRR